MSHKNIELGVRMEWHKYCQFWNNQYFKFKPINGPPNKVLLTANRFRHVLKLIFHSFKGFWKISKNKNEEKKKIKIDLMFAIDCRLSTTLSRHGPLEVIAFNFITFYLACFFALYLLFFFLIFFLLFCCYWLFCCVCIQMQLAPAWL